MKKLFAMFAILALACTVNAASGLAFNRVAFQDDATLTVPLVYSGNISVNGWYILNETATEAQDCVINTMKFNFPAYLTMCQPCIDCNECSEIEPTVMNLYWIETGKVDSTPTAWVTKTNLLDEDYIFNVGNYRSNAALYVANDYLTFIAGGKKSDLTFKYFETEFDGSVWGEVAARPSVAYIKSVTSFSGNVYTNDLPLDEYDYAVMTGTIKLTRNAALTKAALNEAFLMNAPVAYRNWENCDIPSDEIGTCEQVFFTDDLDYADSYLAGKVYKKYAANDALIFGGTGVGAE